MRQILTCAIIGLLIPGAGTTAEPVDFVRDVKPLLQQHCTSCHGATKQRGGLRLDTGAGVLSGSNSGSVIVPGKSAQSLMIKAVTASDGVTSMPPKGPRLTTRQVDLLKAWIDQGARIPSSE